MRNLNYILGSCLVCGAMLTVNNVTNVHAADVKQAETGQVQSPNNNNEQSSSQIGVADQEVTPAIEQNPANDYQQEQNVAGPDVANDIEAETSVATQNSTYTVTNQSVASSASTTPADQIDSSATANNIEATPNQNDTSITTATNDVDVTASTMQDNQVVNPAPASAPNISVANFASTSPSASYTQTQIANAQYIYNFFIQRGWTPNAIAGLIGNIVSESALYPDTWENGGGGGYGLVQWTPGNKYITWAQNQGLDPKSLYAQCLRINYEMSNPSAGQYYATSKYPMTATQFTQSTQSPETLALVFLANYERPANPNQPQRGTQARYWYNYLSGTTDSSDVNGTYTFKVDTNIRLSPSLSGQIVGRYAAGEQVNYFTVVQADGYSWLGYYTASGRICYVAVVDSGSNTDSADIETPDEVVDNTEVPANGTYTFTVDTNIRLNPSLSGQIVGRYSRGQSVNYSSKVEADGYTWLGYETNSGRRCYVAVVDGNVPDDNNTPVVAPPASESSTGTYTFTVDTNIRLNPSLNGQIVGRYSRGQSVNYSSKVEADGYTWLGYVTNSGRQCYVAVVDGNVPDDNNTPVVAPPASESSTGTYTFTVDTNIRLNPNLSGQIVGRYSRGQSVNYSSKVEADGYTWLGYQTASGRTCYVAVVDNYDTPSSAVSQQGSYYFTQTTNIRLSPSLNGQIVGQYQPGETVYYYQTVQADGYTWLTYKTNSGRTCYVAAL
ncbi:phage tail tip lysozyme [Bombilactobacillus thymidiniphilus]|uniref:Phage tail tip lysozyme n=1 Tax=Bombilactobacillus thymidiniphilus TaxID=2923363 RepID=A0ABY4PBI8_9LACO|nr:phage tail tip lysozyme [Bombilactobacillus thymidiniphilus]UQS83133.1 phage tail tip lysozyme [Bombilactobacillus thymidiniphilus]